MAIEQAVKLYREALANPILQNTLNTAPDLESFVAMANQQGFSFTLQEWRQMKNFSVEELKCELSEIPGI